METRLGLPQIKCLKGVRDSRIPTRFDDIQKEILLDKVKGYFAQKAASDAVAGKTYKLGDVIGGKLDSIV